MKINILKICDSRHKHLVNVESLCKICIAAFIPFIAFLDELAEAAKCWRGIPHSFTPSALNAAERRLAFSLCRFMSSAAAMPAFLSAAL